MNTTWIRVFGLCLVVVGCTSTTDPRKASTADILFRRGAIKAETERQREELQDLQLRLAGEQADLGDLQRTIDLLNEDVATARQELSTLNLVIGNLEKKIATLRDTQEVSEQELFDMTERHARLEVEITALKADGGDLEAKRQRLQRLRNEVDALIELMAAL